MPIVRVTEAELSAILVCKDEALSKCESSSDDEYNSSIIEASEHIDQFRMKFHKAKNSEDTRKLVKKLRAKK